MKFLGKVEAVFSISGRGTVIIPASLPDGKIRPGVAIQLRAPNGHTRDTVITSVESANQGSGKPRRAALMIPPDIAKLEIVEGTEIWIAEE